MNSPTVSRRNTSYPTWDGGASSRDSPSPNRGSRPLTSTRRSARQQTVFTGASPAIKSDKGPRKLVEDEARATGNVNWRIYKTYLHASGYFSWGLLLVSILSYQGFGLVEKVWLKTWGEAYERHNSSILPTHALAATYSLAHAIGEEQHVFGAHHHVPTFFSNLSTVDTLDWPNPESHVPRHDNRRHLPVLVSLQLLAQAHHVLRWCPHRIHHLPSFLLPAALIAWLYYLLELGYVRTARNLKLESNGRSPIFSSFAELLEGIVTVRALSAEQKFLDVLHRQIDDTTTMWYNFWMLNRW
ncbi:hypothetical protein FRC08_010093 [Ceratobasidium sp. 394]|nr:hypothetical protein FRC08_010093 [Ceratobasidium sp. 394]